VEVGGGFSGEDKGRGRWEETWGVYACSLQDLGQAREIGDAGVEDGDGGGEEVEGGLEGGDAAVKGGCHGCFCLRRLFARRETVFR